MTKQTSNAGADSSVDTPQNGKLQRHEGTRGNPVDGAGGSDSQLRLKESASDDQPLSLIAQASQENNWWDVEEVESGLPSSVGNVGSTEGTVSVNPLCEHQPGDFHEVEGNEASADEAIAWPPFVGDPFSGNRPSTPREFATQRSSSTNSPPGSLFPRTGEIGERTMGDYLLVREIGRGGMGVVYEAVDRKLNRRAAVKVLTLNASNDPRLAARFHHEAQIVARLNHPNIVSVYGSGEHEGTHFIAFQLVEGRSLDTFLANPPLMDEASEVIRGRVTRDRLKQNRSHACEQPATASRVANGSIETTSLTSSSLRWRWIADLGRQAAAALQHAHETAVVHRDVKPSNLIVEASGQLWVTDFGLAQVSDMSQLTAAGDLLGTLRYMSPEQATGQRGVVDRRSDIYSLGITLYELAAGRAAFATEDRATLLKVILSELPKPVQRVVPGIPRDLATIIGKAIAKLPSERYSTSRALENDLRRFLNGIPIEARPPTWLDWSRYYARRHQRLITITLVLMFLCLTTWSIVSQRHSRALSEQVDLLTDTRHQALKRERQTLILLAQRGRATSVPGRRQESLAALDRAANLGRSVSLDDGERRQLRDEWIAALAIPVDLIPLSVKEFENPIWTSAISDDFSKVVRGRHGSSTIEVFSLNAPAALNQSPLVIPVESVPFNYSVSRGSRFVSAMHWAEDGTSFVLENRDIASGSLVSKFAPPGLRAFAWNDDDRRMAAITSEGMVSIYDAALGTTLATWSGPASSYDLSWQKGADELWLSATGKLYRCDSVTGKVLAEQPVPFDLRNSEPHPNGHLLYGMDSQSHLRSWDTVLKSDDVVSTEPAIRHVLSGDGRIAATESRTGASTLWDALSGERLLTVLGRPVKFDRTGSRFASCNSHSLTTWSVIHSDVFQSIPLRASGGVEVFDVSFTGDSCWMALASQTGIMLHELATGREVSLIQPGTRSVAFVVEEGKELLLSTTVGVHVYERAFDRDRGLCDPPREIATVNEGSGLGSGFATFTSDRRWISFVDGSSCPTLLDRKTDAVRNLTPHLGAHLCSVSPDGRWCISGTFQGRSVRRWDLSQAVDPSLGTDIWDAQPHSRSGFSPDGKWLVVSATNETRVWDTRTWQVVFRRRRLDASDIAAPATFSPDSRLLVISDDQTNLQLIDTSTWNEVTSFQCPEAAYGGDVRFSPQGDLLARYAGNRSQVWNIAKLRAHLRKAGLDW